MTSEKRERTQTISERHPPEKAGAGARMKQAWKEQMAKDDGQSLTSKIGEAMLFTSSKLQHTR